MPDRLQMIIDEIESGKRTTLSDVHITYDDLLQTDRDGNYFINYLNRLDEQSLFSKIDGRWLFEYLIEFAEVDEYVIESVKEHVEIIDLLISNDEMYQLRFISPEIIQKLLVKDDSGNYIIEKYLGNSDVLCYLGPLINDEKVLLEIYQKNGNSNLFRFVGQKVLMANYNDTNMLDYILHDLNVTPRVISNIPKDVEFIKFLINNDYFDCLVKASEEVQLLEIDNHMTLMEILIDKGYTPNLGAIHYVKTIHILLEKGVPLNLKYKTISDRVVRYLYEQHRPDLLAQCSVDRLLKDDSYFEYVLKSIKDNTIKAPVPTLMYPSVNQIVKYYIMVAKNDMMSYVQKLSSKDLLTVFGDATLLEHLLDADSDLTIHKILSDSVKANPKIAVLLNSKGFEQKVVNIPSESNDFKGNYLDGSIDRHGIGPLPEEGELLLDQLSQLFLTDGRSSFELISALVAGYREALIVDYESNIVEIKKLIEIKQKHPTKFCYLLSNNINSFSSFKGSVYCTQPFISTLLHETGHALHYYLADERIPDSYSAILERVRSNPDVLKKVEEFVSKGYETKERIKSLATASCEEYFMDYYTNDRRKKIGELLSKSIVDKKLEYQTLGIHQDTLDKILKSIFTEDEYIACQKRKYISEITALLLREKYGSFFSIADILDAVFEGKLHSGELCNLDGEKMKKTVGHGIHYYKNHSHGFDEMIANFAYIKKSHNASEMLELLRSIVGDELYNMIDGFYHDNMIYKRDVDEKKVGIFNG